MSAESPEPIAFVARPPQVEQPPAVLENPNQIEAHATRAATPEEVRAVAALFAQGGKEQEGAGVVGLLGAYSAGMLLHDLMKDMFTPETREVEVEEKPRKKGEEE
jgi:hypothetical protein